MTTADQLPEARPASAPERPWPGLLSFSEDAARLFHGRSTEILELLRLLQHETASFLYGKSGLGKTSLLQAGLFPRLRETARVPVYLRFSYATGAPAPRLQLFNAIAAAMNHAGVDGPRPRDDESAWAYLHRRSVEWWSARNDLVRPVLVFDQFEELFTLGDETPESREIAKQVVDLLLELTTHRPALADRRTFESTPDTVELYDYDATNYRLLLSFREDFLPQFDQLRERLRINPHNRLALERLSGVSATASVVGTGGHLVTADVAEGIVRFVAGEGEATSGTRPLAQLEVEPWLLCLVCEQLNEQRLAAPKPQPRISADLLSGTRELILAQYYASCVAGFDARVPAFLEDRLLTESGFRNPYPYAEAIRLDGITPRVIDELVDRRLLRREQHMGAQRVEISHDVLGPVLLRYRQQRMQQEAAAISALRDISNRRRLAEGRRRSRRFVILTTAIITTLIAVVALRARAAARAEDMVLWGQELQTHTYTMLLNVVEAKPVSPRVRSWLEDLIGATVALRARHPNETQITAQHVLLAYLAALAASDSDSVDARMKQARVLALTDTLALLPAASAEALTHVETAYRVAGLLAASIGDVEAHERILRRHIALIDQPLLRPGNKAMAIGATADLAAILPPGPEQVELLRKGLDAWGSELDRDARRLDQPERIRRSASQLADELSALPSPDTSRLRELHRVARDARHEALLVAEEDFDDNPTSETRTRLVERLGGLAFLDLLAGRPEAARAMAASALELDSSRTWILQNQLHARVFLGDFDAIADTLLRLRSVVFDIGGERRRFDEAGLEDIAAFRRARLVHPDLDRYERLLRDGIR